MARRGEFELIAQLFAPLSDDDQGLGLADDAALFVPTPGHTTVLTTDTIVADVHYRNDDPARDVGRKALRVSLSDLAAMGATARGYLVNLAIADDIDDAWLEAFAAGLAEDNAAFGVVLLGGDTVRQPGHTSVSVTAVGEARVGRALTRKGAQTGDVVYVSGVIGDGLAGLKVLGSSSGLAEHHVQYLAQRYRLPQPRTALGPRLRGLATAVLDVSDGLVADLAHICDASQVGATLEAAKVPLSPAARAAIEAGLVTREDLLGGGDDYELLFCVPSEVGPAIDRLAAELGLPLTAIGAIDEDDGVRVVDEQGAALLLNRRGHTHF